LRFCWDIQTYGKIIITEMYLPVHRKSIKPIDAGGIAGGVKVRPETPKFYYSINFVAFD